MGVAPALPPEVRAAANKIKKQFPGVVGVFWGRGRTRGRVHAEARLCVHVRWKRPRGQVPSGEMIPKTIDGIRTDVIEVGRIRAHSLSCLSELRAPAGAMTRHGTITAVTPGDGQGALALVSGHVALPVANNKVARSYAGGGAEAFAFDVDHYDGVVQNGNLGGTLDFAVVRFPSAFGNLVHTSHPSAGSTPYTVRPGGLVLGEPVHHVSRLAGRLGPIYGEYQQQAATTTPIDIDLGVAWDEVLFSNLLVVSWNANVAFSVEGESGSLVVDANNIAVGVVVGGSDASRQSYVIPVSALVDGLGNDAGRFFQ